MENKTLWERIKEAFNPPEQQANQSNSVPRPNLWGLNGRQTQMQIRNMMQLKSFERKK